MDIAVFGGTFDPPHFGHLLVARQVLEAKLSIDQVWLLPANTNPDKRVYASAVDRLAMTKFLEEKGIVVSGIDIDRGGETYTIDSVKELLKKKDYSFHWLMGSDLIKPLSKWKGHNELLRSIPFIIFPRPEYPVRELPKNFQLLLENKLLTTNYSSTVIRQRIRRGQSIEGLVPEKVKAYIQTHKLYRNERVYV